MRAIIDNVINQTDELVVLNTESLEKISELLDNKYLHGTVRSALTEYAKCHVLLLVMNLRIQKDLLTDEDDKEFFPKLLSFLSRQRNSFSSAVTESKQLYLGFTRLDVRDKSDAGQARRNREYLHLINCVGLKQQKAIEFLRQHSQVAFEKKSAFRELSEKINSENTPAELLAFIETVKSPQDYVEELLETNKKICDDPSLSPEKIKAPNSFLSDEERQALLKLLKNKLLDYYLTGAGSNDEIPSNVVTFLQEQRAERESGFLGLLVRGFAASQGIKTSSDYCLYLCKRGDKDRAISWLRSQQELNKNQIEELLKKETQGLPWNWRSGGDPWGKMHGLFTPKREEKAGVAVGSSTLRNSLIL